MAPTAPRKPALPTTPTSLFDPSAAQPPAVGDLHAAVRANLPTAQTGLSALAAPAASPGVLGSTGSWGAPAAQAAPTSAAAPDAYLSGLQAAQGHIRTRLGQTLADIDRNRDFGMGMVDQMPGQLGGIFGRSADSMQESGATLADAQANAGLQSFSPAEAQMAPMLASLGQSQAAYEGTVPMLRAGLAERSAMLAAAAQDSASERQSDLNLKMAERQQSTSERSSDLDDKITLALLGSDLDQKNTRFSTDEQIRLNATKEPDTATLSKLMDPYGEGSSDVELGGLIVAENGARYQRVKNSANFKRAVKLIGKNKPSSEQSTGSKLSGLVGWGEKYTVEGIVKKLEKAGDFDTAAVLRHLRGGTPEERALRTDELSATLLSLGQ